MDNFDASAALAQLADRVAAMAAAQPAAVVHHGGVALVRHGLVVQVWRDTPITALDAADHDGTLVATTDTGVCCGMSYDGMAFGPPPPPSAVEVAAMVVAAKVLAKQAVADKADAIALMITGVVPLSERLSWPSKEAAARAVMGGNATAGQSGMIAAEASLAGLTASALAAVIVVRADKYMIAAGMIAGLRRATMNAIDALANPATLAADLAAINTAAEVQASALLAQLNATP